MTLNFKKVESRPAQMFMKNLLFDHLILPVGIIIWWVKQKEKNKKRKELVLGTKLLWRKTQVDRA